MARSATSAQINCALYDSNICYQSQRCCGSELPVSPGDDPAYTASQLKTHQLLQQSQLAVRQHSTTLHFFCHQCVGALHRKNTWRCATGIVCLCSTVLQTANCNCIVLYSIVLYHMCCMNLSHQECAANTQCVNLCIALSFCGTKLTLSVTMAACSTPYCQKDPVLACTAESKSLPSAISKHIIMLVARLTATLCAGAGWQIQASTESCSCSLQRAPVLPCQLCCHTGATREL